MATSLHNNTEKSKIQWSIWPIPLGNLGNLANTTGKSICTVNLSDKSCRLWQKWKKPGNSAENISENLLLYVLCLSGFKKYFLWYKKMGFFSEKMQGDISQQAHHSCAHIPESLLCLLLWDILHWDGGTGRWTGETAKAASQLRSKNAVLRRKLRASLDSKTPLTLRIKTKE